MHLIRVPSNTQCIHMHKLLLFLVNIDNIFIENFEQNFFAIFSCFLLFDVFFGASTKIHAY